MHSRSRNAGDHKKRLAMAKQGLYGGDLQLAKESSFRGANESDQDSGNGGERGRGCTKPREYLFCLRRFGIIVPTCIVVGILLTAVSKPLHLSVPPATPRDHASSFGTSESKSSIITSRTITKAPTSLPPTAHATASLTSPNRQRHQIIYTIFAGRKNRLKIQEPYWKEMIRIGAIDAVHAWDYAFEESDRGHLYDLERKYDFFTVMRPQDVPMSAFYEYDHNHSLPTALERFGEEAEGRARFAWPPERGYTEYYSYYAMTAADGSHTRDDVIIKADDDIVWINTTQVRPFAEYLRNRTDIFLLSASVVNQGLCAYYQQQHGAIPESVVGEKLSLPGNGMGEMHDNSTQALALHRYFLSSEEARQKFFITDPPFYPFDFTINVNFVALRRHDFPEIVQVMREKLAEESDYYDEGAITWDMIRKRNKVEGIYMPLVVSHATFGAQNNKTKDVLTEYAEHGRKELASFYGNVLDDWAPQDPEG